MMGIEYYISILVGCCLLLLNCGNPDSITPNVNEKDALERTTANPGKVFGLLSASKTNIQFSNELIEKALISLFCCL
jgi:hypothetical protein